MQTCKQLKVTLSSLLFGNHKQRRRTTIGPLEAFASQKSSHLALSVSQNLLSQTQKWHSVCKCMCAKLFGMVSKQKWTAHVLKSECVVVEKWNGTPKGKERATEKDKKESRVGRLYRIRSRENEHLMFSASTAPSNVKWHNCAKKLSWLSLTK